MSTALFEDLGDWRFLPTELARGPWSPDALHGGPVAALVTRQAEAALAASGTPAVRPARLSLALERAVPLAPLGVHASIVRPGGKVQVVDVTVSDEAGKRLAAATVQAIRARPVELPDGLPVPEDRLPPPPPDEPSRLEGWEFNSSGTAYHRDATEHRLVRGSLFSPGPVVDWISLTVPVIDGESPSAFQRAAAAADFLNGVSWVLPGADWLFINPDLTLTLHRLPVGEQIAVDAVTRVGPDGIGTAEAELYDTTGRIGRAVQTLLVEPR